MFTRPNPHIVLDRRLEMRDINNSLIVSCKRLNLKGSASFHGCRNPSQLAGMTIGRLEVLLCKESKIPIPLKSLCREVVSDLLLTSDNVEEMTEDGQLAPLLASCITRGMSPIVPDDFYEPYQVFTSWYVPTNFETLTWRTFRRFYYVFQFDEVLQRSYAKRLLAVEGEPMPYVKSVRVYLASFNHHSRKFQKDHRLAHFFVDCFIKFIEDLDALEKPFFSLEGACTCHNPYCRRVILFTTELNIPQPWQSLFERGQIRFCDLDNLSTLSHRFR